MNEQRLIDLETKFSHQDVLIEELRATVHEQHRTIDRLEKMLKRLTDVLKGSGKEVEGAVHEKPPHY